MAAGSGADTGAEVELLFRFAILLEVNDRFGSRVAFSLSSISFIILLVLDSDTLNSACPSLKETKVLPVVREPACVYWFLNA